MAVPWNLVSGSDEPPAATRTGVAPPLHSTDEAVTHGALPRHVAGWVRAGADLTAGKDLTIRGDAHCAAPAAGANWR